MKEINKDTLDKLVARATELKDINPDMYNYIMNNLQWGFRPNPGETAYLCSVYVTAGDDERMPNEYTEEEKREEEYYKILAGIFSGYQLYYSKQERIEIPHVWSGPNKNNEIKDKVNSLKEKILEDVLEDLLLPEGDMLLHFTEATLCIIKNINKGESC